MHMLKVTQIGNSLGIVLSKEMLLRLRIDKGGSLYWYETPNGVEITPYNPDFATQLEVAEDIMRENRDVLKKLSE